MTGKAVLFEPWNLGDSLIAAAIALQAPERFSLACNSRWHPLIRLASPPGSLDLLAVDLDYVNRQRNGRFSFGALTRYLEADTVLSIRGDPRDYWAAKNIFPNARIRMTGLPAFLARRSRFLDFPYKTGFFPIRNRYRAWAQISGIDFRAVEDHYRNARKAAVSMNAPVTIHIGAQWRAKQFPGVRGVCDTLAGQGVRTRILAGPNDFLPPGIQEAEVSRPMQETLVDILRESSAVLTNDSGPMHLAALLGCRTIALSRVSNIDEWLPPGVESVIAPNCPRGYRPDNSYCSDSTLSGWPDISKITDRITKAS